MAILRPFRGITYDPNRVDIARVVAPPYDVIGPADQRRYYQQDPHNVVRLIAGEVFATDSAEDNKYLRATRFFHDWLNEGVLREEREPTVYVYRHEFVDPITNEKRTRQGILGVVQLEPFGEGILPHERTHARAKADRLSLTRAVQANLSPIFSMYDDPHREIWKIVESSISQPPRLAIQTDDGERHSVWALHGMETFRELARVFDASRLYVADGHHRYETALNFRNKMRAEHPEARPDAAFNFVLMLLVDVQDPGLRILPTHRFVHDLPDFEPKRFVGNLRQRYGVKSYPDRRAFIDALREPVSDHRIGIALGGPTFFTTAIPRSASADPVSKLDVTALHREVLEESLGLAESALEEEHFVGYSRDLDVVLEQVESGRAQAAFILRPPEVADVVAVASAGQMMPQKSTYFYPKPASGIVFNPLDPAIQIPAL